ncbi:unnamed protein product, partial [Discosporangium mesarthrocarpum]
MSISPAVVHTPTRNLTPVKTPARNGVSRGKPGSGLDPMSVCRGSTAGKENRHSRLFPRTPSSSARKASNPNPKSDHAEGHGGDNNSGSTCMPPPLPRSPGGGGKSGLGRSSASPLHTK